MSQARLHFQKRGPPNILSVIHCWYYRIHEAIVGKILGRIAFAVGIPMPTLEAAMEAAEGQK